MQKRKNFGALMQHDARNTHHLKTKSAIGILRINYNTPITWSFEKANSRQMIQPRTSIAKIAL